MGPTTTTQGRELHDGGGECEVAWQRTRDHDWRGSDDLHAHPPRCSWWWELRWTRSSRTSPHAFPLRFIQPVPVACRSCRLAPDESRSPPPPLTLARARSGPPGAAAGGNPLPTRCSDAPAGGTHQTGSQAGARRAGASYRAPQPDLSVDPHGRTAPQPPPAVRTSDRRGGDLSPHSSGCQSN
ncbi:hypothetical protein GUJ93_ZPchr0002g23623 [Zizania palustris]|uniref:Uncharacterized protein n=1 Tax=Zizania palustris TaxID=103762 RepID=A0A8J5VEW1_ZIZPA|nr:hypothetical protein GUJ93_ZPchr0002g23623 [Zizania palustris]